MSATRVAGRITVRNVCGSPSGQRWFGEIQTVETCGRGGSEERDWPMLIAADQPIPAPRINTRHGRFQISKRWKFSPASCRVKTRVNGIPMNLQMKYRQVASLFSTRMVFFKQKIKIQEDEKNTTKNDTQSFQVERLARLGLGALIHKRLRTRWICGDPHVSVQPIDGFGGLGGILDINLGIYIQLASSNTTTGLAITISNY